MNAKIKELEQKVKSSEETIKANANELSKKEKLVTEVCNVMGRKVHSVDVTLCW